jgi:hypothetical protein
MGTGGFLIQLGLDSSPSLCYAEEGGGCCIPRLWADIKKSEVGEYGGIHVEGENL